VIQSEAFIRGARRRGTTIFVGVPCSFLTPLIDGAISDSLTRYAVATSEGEAVGVAVGSWLAGGTPVVMCQNSGFGNMVNPLTSVVWPCRIPFLMVVTWRGQPGLKDEPQHELMGQIMLPLVELLDVEHAEFPSDEALVGQSLDRAWSSMEERCLPYCLVMKKGAVASGTLTEAAPARPHRGALVHLDYARPPARLNAIERVLAAAPDDAAMIATTGKTGRELFTIADRPQHFYQVGGMGCASAVGLGAALHTPRPVVVLDGDGAALMKLGNMATIGVQAPENLVHVVLDNGVHDSTGGQRTASAAVDFPEIAIACGYRRAVSCTSLDDLEFALSTAFEEPGPHLVRIAVRPGSIEGLARPDVHPHEVARRFRDFICSEPRELVGAATGERAA
jgi:phosphonopyruvate decarboxylase